MSNLNFEFPCLLKLKETMHGPNSVSLGCRDERRPLPALECPLFFSRCLDIWPVTFFIAWSHKISKKNINFQNLLKNGAPRSKSSLLSKKWRENS